MMDESLSGSGKHLSRSLDSLERVPEEAKEDSVAEEVDLVVEEVDSMEEEAEEEEAFSKAVKFQGGQGTQDF